MRLSQKLPYSVRRVLKLLYGQLIVVLAIFSTKATRLARSESRIVDGVNVTPLNKYPMIVSIFSKGKPEYAGTILNKHYVLTSAECAGFVKENLKRVQVVAGVHQVGDPDPRYIQKVNVRSATVHVRVNDPRKGLLPNNIGIIRIKNPLVWNDHVAPTNLPPPDWDILPNENINAIPVGWGLGRNESYPFAPTRPLQEIELRALTTEECQRLMQLQYFFDDSQICMDEIGGAGACEEDQGGPAFVYDEKKDKHIQIGILSDSVRGCGAEKDPIPSVWTKVSKYIHWINEAVRECNAPRII